MITINYKSYSAHIEYDAQDRIFTGQVIGIQDIVVFHADSVTGLGNAFEESIEEYLAACAHFVKTPAQPACGKTQ